MFVLNSTLSMQQIRSVQCTKRNGRTFLGEKSNENGHEILKFR